MEGKAFPFLQTIHAHQGSFDFWETLFNKAPVHRNQTSPEAMGVHRAEDKCHAQEPVRNVLCLHILQQGLKSVVHLDCRAEKMKTPHAPPGDLMQRPDGNQKKTQPLALGSFKSSNGLCGFLELIDYDPPTPCPQQLSLQCVSHFSLTQLFINWGEKSCFQ